MKLRVLLRSPETLTQLNPSLLKERIQYFAFTVVPPKQNKLFFFITIILNFKLQTSSAKFTGKSEVPN